ncbi:unnamed protein product [Rotaria sp. Silwood2]|nr:unnamed protein product [Rotaria sp. Silwood2]
MADFTGTNITDGQLRSALSIHGARLPNGTLSHDTNLLNNSQADCNISLVDSWTLKTGNVTTMMSDKNNTNCQFTLQSLAIGATMLQRVNLLNKWDSKSWPYSQAVLSATIPNIPVNAQWTQNGVTVAGGNGHGDATNQLYWPWGLFVDDDQTMIIADCNNGRIIQWKMGDKNGQVIAVDHNPRDGLNQFACNPDVLMDKETNSLITCDLANERVVRWSDLSGTIQEETILDNINCWGLAMDDQRYLYISNIAKHEVRRYQIGDKNGTLVAGGHGRGNDFNQLNIPVQIFVDRKQAVYVSDNFNHRVMKWDKGAAEGIVVAGGQGEGQDLTQLSGPRGLFVDMLGTVYVVDTRSHRVMRWPKGAKNGTAIVGGNDAGEEANQLDNPIGLSFDRRGNLYVADSMNARVQRYSIEYTHYDG